MFKLCLKKLLLLAFSILTVLLSNSHNGVLATDSRHVDRNFDDVINEKSFVQSKVLGNCCLVASMATLAGNAELYNKVVDFSNGKFEFNIHKLGKLHRVAVDADSLPRTNSKLVYSTSANDDVVGPLLEKALVDLHFDGDYESCSAVPATTVLTSLTNGYFEEFPVFSTALPFKANEVVNFGLKTGAQVLVTFKRPEDSRVFHCYTLLDVRDGVARVYNPHGKYHHIAESRFYENLQSLSVSYNESSVFRMPQIETSVEMDGTWPALKPLGEPNYVHYHLVVDEDDTEVLINLIKKRHHKVESQIFIFSSDDETVHVSVLSETGDSGKTYDYSTHSLRATLKRGEYRVLVTLSDFEGITHCDHCKEFLESGGDHFQFRLAASKHCSVEKRPEEETGRWNVVNLVTWVLAVCVVVLSIDGYVLNN